VQELIAIENAKMQKAGAQVEYDFHQSRTVDYSGADKHCCRLCDGLVYCALNYPTP
jgi:hypothetical protein